MERPSSGQPCIFLVFILIFPFLLQPAYPLAIDNHKLIFNQCPNQTSLNPSHSRLLPRLFQVFVARSSKTSFFETIVADDESAVSGAFQCRKDLSPDECRSCVSKFQGLSEDLCAETLPARIQLSGCYARYQVDNDDDADPGQPGELLHKGCSKTVVKKYGFEEMKYEALATLESCVLTGNGFCDMSYHESIHVVAQCAASLQRVCDCGGCISDAVQIAVEECPYSVSGEVYLDSCFITYDYYKDHGFGGYSFEDDNGIGATSPKLIAIVVGGLIAILLGIALCYFLSSCGKKERWYYGYNVY